MMRAHRLREARRRRARVTAPIASVPDGRRPGPRHRPTAIGGDESTPHSGRLIFTRMPKATIVPRNRNGRCPRPRRAEIRHGRDFDSAGDAWDGARPAHRAAMDGRAGLRKRSGRASARYRPCPAGRKSARRGPAARRVRLVLSPPRSREYNGPGRPRSRGSGRRPEDRPRCGVVCSPKTVHLKWESLARLCPGGAHEEATDRRRGGRSTLPRASRSSPAAAGSEGRKPSR
jgi:hypothetical protein